MINEANHSPAFAFTTFEPYKHGMRLSFLVVTILSLVLQPGALADTAPPTPFTAFLKTAGFEMSNSTAISAPVELVSARQDFKHLTFDESCHLLTPIQIGDDHFAKGLGMHANGSAVFTLNGSFTHFLAKVGVDNNTDTAGRGSVTFTVKVDGKQILETPVLHGRDAPQAIDISLAGAKQIELIVGDGGDGIAYDQADWGDACVVDSAGHRTYLSDASGTTGTGPVFFQQSTLPCSFVYGGQPSATLLPTWQREEKPANAQSDRTLYEVTWKEPGTGFSATWRATVFKDRSAMEFGWSFANDGTSPAEPLTQVLALDLHAQPPDGRFQVLSSTGGLDGSLSGGRLGFELNETDNQNVSLGGQGGRSSNQSLPFFLIRAPGADQGVFVGVGWSGQWEAQIGQAANRDLAATVQMPGMNLALPAGEKIIAPSILLGSFSGVASNGSNALREMLYDKYTPLLDGKKPLPPVSWNHWFILQNGISESILEKQADFAAAAGIEYFCIDAGWFDGDFPDGVGNWTVNATKFPHGIGAVGDYVASKGMKLGLWFEPERAAANTKITRDHPDWIHGNLVDFGNPQARDFIFNLIKGHYDNDHVRWIRWDFNTDPLGVWDSMDAPDQKGLAQIRHIMGLYDVLDRLMKACPDLLIEGCASGGRRIDLETIKRSHTFWKSDDTADIPSMRFHETGGNVFLPSQLLNTNVLPVTGPELSFDVMSIFGGPLGFQCDWPNLTDADRTELARQIAIYKTVRPLLNADYYPLFAQQRLLTTWTGWQFNDPTKGEGFFVILRPRESPYGSADIELQGLDAGATYTVTKIDSTAVKEGERVSRSATSAELTTPWAVTLGLPGTAAVYRYEKVK
jgi:alpha-galactosidase